MDREQISTGAALSLEQLKRAYDAEVRNFLSGKQILARIMKRCVKEFQSALPERQRIFCRCRQVLHFTYNHGILYTQYLQFAAQEGACYEGFKAQ